jgi:type I restriction enzyme S subunit
MSPPNEWQQRRLREITVRTAIWNPRNGERDRIRYIDVSGVDREKLRVVAETLYSAADAPSRARKIVQAGDTIFATVRPTLRRIAQVPTSLDGEIVSTAFCVLRPDPDQLDPDFLFFVTQLESIMSGISALETGASYPAVRDSDVLDQIVPVPPLAEQREIAAALNATRSALLHESECEAEAAALKRVAMQTLFTRGLRGETQKDTDIGPMPESWHPRTILDLCEIWSGGTPRKSVPEYWIGPIPWVSGKDLKVPTLHDAIDHVSQAAVEAGSRLAPAGAVLILVRGMGLAKDLPIALISRPMAFNQDIKALVSRGQFSGSFIRSAIYSEKDRLLSRIVPSAHGTMTLNLDDVETFKVPCPSNEDEAEEIASVLETIDRKIDLHRRKCEVLDELFKALLHKLMTGEIRVVDLNLSALNRAAPVAEVAA